MEIGISGSNGFLGASLKRHIDLTSRSLTYNHINRSTISTSNLKLFNNCNYFVHCAEPASNEEYTTEFSRRAQLNAKILSDFFGDKLIYISTVLVYGLKNQIPHKENEQQQPFNEYTNHKTIVENEIRSNNSRIIRLSNLIGSNMHGKNMINNLINAIKSGREIHVASNQIRDFVDVEDASSLIVNTLQKSCPQIINIGSGHPRSIGEVANEISTVMNLEARVDYSQLDQNRIECCLPDVSILESLNSSFRYTTFQESIKAIIGDGKT